MTTLDFNESSWRESLSKSVQVNVNSVRIGTEGVEQALLTYLPDIERDFLDVAMAVYVTDRLVLRSPEHPSDWTTAMNGRKLHLHLPVRHQSFWMQQHVYESLIVALNYFTGDEWSFEFCLGRSGGGTRPLFTKPLDRPFVGLFSGGLDSFAGAVNQLMNSEHATGVLVAAHTNSRLLARQRNLIRETNRKLASQGKDFRHVPLKHDLDKRAISRAKGERQEGSQRSRGFLFLALGLVVARVLGLRTLHVYENGVGAINLPQTLSGLGIDHTRALHPEGIKRMVALAQAIFNEPMYIHNPSLWKTKGQMCVEVQYLGYGELAVKTVSCDGFPRRKPQTKEQCGLCTSCLLRRASLAAGDLDNLDRDNRTYESDVYELLPNRTNRERLLPLRSMQVQIERLRHALDSSEPEVNLLRAFPELLSVRLTIASLEDRSIQTVTADLMRLFRAYVREWELFSFMLPRPVVPALAGPLVRLTAEHIA